jgi:aspartyl-tRNA(Asn)/glutamyl-tRNA(Gln) amidotransferase subunit B
VAQREKEEVNDYRYFPCPDLPPFTVTDALLEQLKAAMPQLPEALAQSLQQKGLSAQDAGVLTEDKPFADYFMELLQHTAHTKAAANWMLGPVKKWMNETNSSITAWPLSAATMANLIDLVEEGSISFSTAATRLLPALLQKPEAAPKALAAELNLIQESSTDALETWIDEVLQSMPDKVAEYKKGKKGLIGLFVGEVKKRSKGKADPKRTMELLEGKLSV